MIQAAIDTVFVKVRYTSTRPITDVARLVAMQHNTSIDLSDLITITGEVVSIPKKVSNKREYKGFSTKHIEVGDTAIFSYLVVGNIKQVEEDFIHKNEVFYNGEKYFSTNITDIFAVIKGEEIVMLNGYVMLTDFTPSRLILPQHMRRLKQATKSKVISIGYPKNNSTSIKVKQGDNVFFNPFLAQRYKINDKPFVILQQDKILGKEVEK